MHLPQISILTPSYNQGEFIEQNILSVLNQNIKGVQHIIIDGGSTDTTISILEKYPHLSWKSEADEGQSDAINKGLAMADGDIIGWLNSDDYYNENIFKDVLSHFEDPAVQWIIGDSNDYHEDLKLSRYVKSPFINYKVLLRNSGKQRQPPTFFRRDILNRVRGIDKTLNYVMDYDLWIRLARISEPKMVSMNYANFRIHTDQKTNNVLNLLGFIREIDITLQRQNVSLFRRKIILLNRYKGLVKRIMKVVLIKLGMLDSKYLNRNISTRKWT